MNKALQLIFTLSSLSTGIMLPVFTLVLLEKGANLKTLPLLMAVYSLTVLFLELPSGILADMVGRKAVFLVSCGFNAISLSVLFFSSNLIPLIIAVVFSGLGRAFSSGSLDAVIIDRALENGGEDCLPKVTSQLAVLEGSGLAAGGIAGGILASVLGTYNIIIILRLVLTAIIFLPCLIFVKEPRVQPKTDEGVPDPSLAEVIRQGKSLILNHHELGLILADVFFTGFFLFTMETYWQPAFTSMPDMSGNSWLLGIITFTGFLSVTGGNILVRRFLSTSKSSWWKILYISRIAMAATMVAFSILNGAISFIVCYAGIYLMLGIGNIPESSLINKLTPGEMRASMLSLNSLVSQVGGLCASLFSSAAVVSLKFSGIWLVSGILMFCYSAFLTVIVLVRKVR